ncbi:type II toxin-antitoxin system HicB family antitoxin [Litorimonas sp.]|uniref:type II toxin-antitoxin system HicB family antitoxin n=1 Tax=Litorimonas sp. TaxID=1892381 RepID=UPI003A85B691
MFYIALIHKDGDSDYGVSFPDFPGCITAGDTFDQAMAMAKEALGFHAEGMIEDGESLPAPSSYEKIKADKAGFWAEDLADAEIARVPLLINIAAPKRINISLDKNLLSAIDQAAKEQGMTRSAFLASAALQHLG